MTSSSSSSPLRSVRIGARLGMAFAAVIALMVCIVVVALLRMNSLSHATHQIIDVEWAKTEAAATLGTMANLNARRTVQQLVSTPQERQQLRQEILGGREMFVQAFKYLQDTVDRPEARALMDKAEQARQAYVTSQTRFYELLDGGMEIEATNELKNQTLPQLALLQKYSDEVAALCQLCPGGIVEARVDPVLQGTQDHGRRQHHVVRARKQQVGRDGQKRQQDLLPI